MVRECCIMMPIAQLMIEHRLFDRMMKLMRGELTRIGMNGRADPAFIDEAVIFMRNMADTDHHGKEERILFKELVEKPLTDELRKMTNDLIAEHLFLRGIVNDLARARDNYVNNKPNALAEIISSLNTIVEFYPKHTGKEDKHFFVPAMSYFSDKEKDDMFAKFYEFDSRIFHEEYAGIVKSLEEKSPVQPEPPSPKRI